MARFIGRTLVREARSVEKGSSPCCRILVGHRNQSSQATKPKPQLSEIEREEYEVALKLLEDHIQRILVKKATPDWLPFLPGSSFWVPPRPSPSNLASLINKFTIQPSPNHHHSLSLRGWPSSQQFFIQENESALGEDTGVEVNNPEGMEVSVQVKVLPIPENIALSEDEEG